VNKRSVYPSASPSPCSDPRGALAASLVNLFERWVLETAGISRARCRLSSGPTREVRLNVGNRK
jgi:hypothetical protein